MVIVDVRQIVGCLQVAGQRLSRTAHYDFGMRTLKLLIQKCEALKAAASADAASDYASPLRLHSSNNAGALEMLHCHSALKRIVVPRLLPQVGGSPHPQLSFSNRTAGLSQSLCK
jgi:hypothetical protein